MRTRPRNFFTFFIIERRRFEARDLIDGFGGDCCGQLEDEEDSTGAPTMDSGAVHCGPGVNGNPYVLCDFSFDSEAVAVQADAVC